MKKIEILRCKGYPLTYEEENLRAKLESLQRELNQPNLFKGRMFELTAHIRMQVIRSIYQTINLSIHQSLVYLSIFLSFYLSIFLSIYLILVIFSVVSCTLFLSPILKDERPLEVYEPLESSSLESVYSVSISSVEDPISLSAVLLILMIIPLLYFRNC